MSTTAFNGYIYVPQLPHDSAGGFFSSTINAAGERVGYLFQIPKSGTLTKVFIRTGTVTTDGDVAVRLETIDASGDPSGTLIDASAAKTVTLAASDDDKWITVTFDSSFSVTRSAYVALVLDHVTGDYQFEHLDFRWINEFPRGAHRTGGSWADVARSPVFMLEYSDSSHPVIPGVFPVDAFVSEAVTSVTTPDEVGLRFKFPFDVSLAGLRFMNQGDVGSYKLYDTDGTTVLESVTWDGDLRTLGASGPDNYQLYLFSNSTILKANSFYRITVLPTTSTTVTLRGFDVDTVSFMDVFEGGQDWTWTEQTDGGGFTEIATRRPNIGLILDGVQDTAGGVGSTTIGRAGGGMQ